MSDGGSNPREIPFGKLRAGSRPAGGNAGLRDDAAENLRNDQSRIVMMIKFAGALLLLVAASAAAGAEDVHSIAAAVDEHYNHLRTLQAEFTEEYRGAGMERTEAGTVWLAKGGSKKPGKMRWEYRSPREKLFVSDGRDAWFYVPDDRQARKTDARKLDDVRSPLAFLLGKSKLEKELQGLSLAPDVVPVAVGDVVLRGVPHALADRISEILLEVTPEHQIVRIVINDVDGSVTEYRFSNQKENVSIPEGRFGFSPPAGTETVEGELGP
jgi:outer membrane lipoprotein carrier protein